MPLGLSDRDNICCVTHKRCKQKPLTLEKLNDAVSVKSMLEVTPQTFQAKFEVTMSLKFAKKIRLRKIPASADKGGS